MDLRLDDPDLPAKAARRLDRLGGGIRDTAARHRDAVFRQQLLRLVFVDVHLAHLSPPAGRGRKARPARLPGEGQTSPDLLRPRVASRPLTPTLSPQAGRGSVSRTRFVNLNISRKLLSPRASCS